MKFSSFFRLGIIASALAVLVGSRLSAAVPLVTGYQGRVQVAGANYTGIGQLKFALLNPDGTTLWSNDGTSFDGSEPGVPVPLSVNEGLFNVLLGDDTMPNMQPLPADLFSTNPDVRLRVWFDDGVNGSVQLEPDTRLASVPYALAAHLPNGSVSAEHLASGTIDPAKIASANAPELGSVLSYDGLGFSWADLGSLGSLWSPTAAGISYSGGNVGIGTAATGARFHLFSPNAVCDLRLQNGGGAPGQWKIQSDGGLFQQGPSLVFYDEVASKYRMVINGYGGVGINTPSPRSLLHVHSSTATAPITLSTATGSEGPASFKIQADSGLFQQGTSLVFYDEVASKYRMVINGYGGVGINTPAPRSLLHVHSSTATAPIILSTATGSEGPASFKIQADSGLGGQGRSLVIFDEAASQYRMSINGQGNVGIGTVTPQAKLDVAGTTRTCVLTITGGCDLAEPFPMKTDDLPKGSVVVIDDEHPGRLMRSDRAYDSRVAGIISGANGINPGIMLQQEGVLDQGQNVALSGRVYVHADASTTAIKPGDLLTTSDRPGHAMKATDHLRARGAILGKAMTALSEGQGMVLVLVTLQ